MDQGELILLVLGGVAALAGAYRDHRRAYPPRLRERRPPRVTIAAAQPGTFVLIVGRVLAGVGEQLVAPFTGRAAIAHDAAVTTLRLVDHGDGDPVRRLEKRSLRATPFLLDDGTGQALVDPRGAYVRLVLDRRTRTPRGERVVVHARELIADVFGYEELLLDEGVLTVGSEVVVHGLVRIVGDSAATLYRAQGTHRIELVGAADRSAVVSNLPADLDVGSAERRGR